MKKLILSLIFCTSNIAFSQLDDCYNPYTPEYITKSYQNYKTTKQKLIEEFGFISKEEAKIRKEEIKKDLFNTYCVQPNETKRKCLSSINSESKLEKSGYYSISIKFLKCKLTPSLQNYLNMVDTLTIANCNYREILNSQGRVLATYCPRMSLEQKNYLRKNEMQLKQQIKNCYSQNFETKSFYSCKRLIKKLGFMYSSNTPMALTRN